MTDEQLKRGKELNTEIDKLKGRIEYWEHADRIVDLRLQYPCTYPSEDRTFIDDGAFVNFDEFKTSTLQAMSKRLEELEKEYREL